MLYNCCTDSSGTRVEFELLWLIRQREAPFNVSGIHGKDQAQRGTNPMPTVNGCFGSDVPIICVCDRFAVLEGSERVTVYSRAASCHKKKQRNVDPHGLPDFHGPIIRYYLLCVSRLQLRLILMELHGAGILHTHTVRTSGDVLCRTCFARHSNRHRWLNSYVHVDTCCTKRITGNSKLKLCEDSDDTL